MEFFSHAKVVRLQSHHGKYLLADDDQETVRQSRNASSNQVRWTVELVDGNPHAIRLKSCYGKYLTATDHAIGSQLRMTGKKVSQAARTSMKDGAVEWEPRNDGGYVKLKAKCGTYLRGNGGTPPWRNTVTHDVPHRTSTQDWVLWFVDVVDITVDANLGPDQMGSYTSFASLASTENEDLESSPSMDSSTCSGSQRFGRDQDAMELFQKAKVVRLRSHHDKYLIAGDDEESVCQDRNGSVTNAKWTVEFVEHGNVLRFKSCYGKYLTASNLPFLLGMTGKKVLQTLTKRLDSSVEWEPIREGFQVRLKTRYGQYLRANGGLPPWRNSITHDIPHRTSTQDWILWDVDVVEIRVQSPRRQPLPHPSSPKPSHSASPSPSPSPSPSVSLPSVHTPPPKLEPDSPPLSRQESSDSLDGSPVKAKGRMIYYQVGNENGDVERKDGELSFTFRGNGMLELKQKLQEETGMENIVVCSRNIVNGKLYPLRLHLPPNNTDMHVVVVPSALEDDES